MVTSNNLPTEMEIDVSPGDLLYASCTLCGFEVARPHV